MRTHLSIFLAIFSQIAAFSSWGANIQAILRENKSEICDLNLYGFDEEQRERVLFWYWKEIPKKNDWPATMLEQAIEETKEFLLTKCGATTSELSIMPNKQLTAILRSHEIEVDENGLFNFEFEGKKIPLYAQFKHGRRLVVLHGVNKVGKHDSPTCLSLAINDSSMEIAWLGVASTACPIPREVEKAGNFLLRLAEAIAQKLALRSIRLNDMAEIFTAEGQGISLAALRIFAGEPTWYESKGFEYTDYPQDREQLRDFPMKNILEPLKEMVENKLVVLSEVKQNLIIKKKHSLLNTLPEFYDKEVPLHFELLEYLVQQYSQAHPNIDKAQIKAGPFFTWLWKENSDDYAMIFNFLFMSNNNIWPSQAMWPKVMKFPWNAEMMKDLRLL
jgi:hypothetical protein